MRFLLLLLLLVPAQLSSQAPSLLLSQYPAPNQTGVPRNAALAFTFDFTFGFNTGAITLRQAGSSTNIQLGNAASWTDQKIIDLALRPAATLAASTTYTVSINSPVFSTQFNFTTGADLDKTPPNLISISPDPGSTIDLSGPIRFQFDEPLLSWSGYTSAVDGPGYKLDSYPRLSADRRTVEVRLQPQTRVPRVVTVTLGGPFLSSLQDVSGNSYPAKPIVARFLTTAAGDGRGPQLLGTYPESGAVNIPTNAVVQLLFDHPIDSNSLQQGGIVLEASGKPVTVTPQVNGSNGGLIILGGVSLLPGTSYRVRTTGQIIDTNGLTVDRPYTFDFTTGSAPLPDTQDQPIPQPATQNGLPVNTHIGVRSPRPLPSYAPLAFPTLSPSRSFSSDLHSPIPVSANLVDNAHTIIFVPRDPLSPRSGLSIDTGALLDITGSNVSSGISFSTGTATDTAPPQVLASTPTDGSTGIPPNTPIRVLFNEPVGLDTPIDGLRVRANGQLIDGKVTFSGSFLDFKPTSPLAGDSDYTIEVPGAADLSGNIAAPWIASFHTAPNSTPPTTPFRLIRSSFDSGDPAPTDTIELQFNYPLAAGHTFASVYLSVSLSIGPQPFNCPFRYEVAGDTIRLIPLIPWPAGRDVTAGITTQDIWSRQTSFSTTFRPTVVDTVQPEVVSIDPPPGTPLASPATIRVTFSKPMLEASQLHNGLIITQGESTVATAGTWSDDRMSVLFTVRATYTGYTTSGYLTRPFALLLSSNLTDLSGNPLKPVVAQFPALPYNGSPVVNSILASWPDRGGTLDLRSPITLYLYQPVDAALMNREIFLYTSQGRTAGSWSVSEDGLLATFRPDAPWPPSSSVHFAQIDTILDLSFAGFNTAAAEASYLAVKRTTLSSSNMPSNQVIDVEFTQEPPQGPLFQVRYGQAASYIDIPVDESQPRQRVRRIKPRNPLPTGQFVGVSVRPEIAAIGSTNLGSSEVIAPIPSTPITLRFRAPYPGADNAPRNTRISIVYSDLLNPISINDTTVKVVANGSPVLVQFSTQTKLFAPLLITPLEPLPANAQIDVSIAGIEDRLGRVLDPTFWSFHTGIAIDKTVPKLLYSDIAGQSSSPGFDPQAPVRITFDEPLDPASLFQQSAFNTPLLIDFSSDLRTVSLIPAGGWSRGDSANFRVTPTDWSGNQSTDSFPSFIAGFDSDSSPLSVRATSPRDGQTGVPLNVRFAVLFNKPIGSEAANSIRLMNGGQQIGFISVTGAQSGRLLFRPEVPLQPLTDYQLTIDGVQDAGGNVLTTPQTISFRTGDQYDAIGPSIVSLHAQKIGQPITVQLSETIDLTALPVTTDFLTFRDSAGYQHIEPASAAWSDDTLTLTITPARNLQSGITYTLNPGATDLAGLPVTALSIVGTTFIPSDDPDTSPVLVRIYPQDGSASVPTNVSLYITFTRSVLTPLIRLYQDDRLVQTVARANTSSLRLSQALQPNTQYRIQTDAFVDDQGNNVAPASSAFTTGASSDFSSLQFVSATPANNAAGVAVDTTWQLAFNQPLVPIFFLDFPPSSTRNIPYRSLYSINGKEFDITPSPAWPAASTISMVLSPSSRASIPSVTDWTGRTITQQIPLSFKTAAINDPTPPVLESVDPPAGTTIPGGVSSISLRFSKPVGVATSGSLQVFYGATVANPSGAYSADFRTITYKVQAPANSRITIIGTDLRDNADNPLDPFVLEFPTGDLIPTGAPQAQMTEPTFNSITSTTGITVRFDRVMNSDSVVQAFHVTQDGQNLAGTIDVSENGRTYRFRAAAPYNAGSNIRIFILPTAVDLNGTSFNTSFPPFAQFTIPGKPGTLNISQYSFRRTAPSDAVLAIEFDADLDPASVDRDTVWLRVGSQLVPGTPRLRDGRIIEFTPDALLQPGVEYVLTAGAALQSSDGLNFRGMDLHFRAVAPESAPEVQSVEWSEWQGHRAIHVLFTRAISPVGLRRIAAPEDEVLLSTAADELWVLPASPQIRALSLEHLRSRTGRAFATHQEVR
jgi:hypothetical protein